MSHLLSIVCLSPHLFPSVSHRPSTLSHLQHIIIRLSMSVSDLCAPSPVHSVSVSVCLCLCVTCLRPLPSTAYLVCLSLSVSDLSMPSPVYSSEEEEAPKQEE